MGPSTEPMELWCPGSCEERKEVSEGPDSLLRRAYLWRGFVWNPLLTQDPQKQPQAESSQAVSRVGQAQGLRGWDSACPIFLQGRARPFLCAGHQNPTPPPCHPAGEIHLSIYPKRTSFPVSPTPPLLKDF